MSTWRDRTSLEAQDELDRLLNFSLDAAMHEIEKRAEFYPFGAVIANTGDIRLIVSEMLEEHPLSLDVLDTLYKSLQVDSPSIHAAATVSDVKLSDGRDGVRVELEHKEGTVIAVVLPYQSNGSGVEYGSLQAEVGLQHIWLSS
jgi:hypothetical protein